jgi:hypothetical protein
MKEHRARFRLALRRSAALATILAGALAFIACERTASSVPQSRPVVVDTTQGIARNDEQGDSALRFPILPDPAKTPGATLPVTAADICVPGYSKKVRNVPIAVKRMAYEEYGIQSHEPGEYEVDHLISLELGGSNSLKNLWPESFRTHPWNAHVKDALENELHRRVCAGTMDLATAQRVIASNWVIGYRNYVHPNPPSATTPRTKRNRQRQQPPPQFDGPAP